MSRIETTVQTRGRRFSARPAPQRPPAAHAAHGMRWKLLLTEDIVRARAIAAALDAQIASARTVGTTFLPPGRGAARGVVSTRDATAAIVVGAPGWIRAWGGIVVVTPPAPGTIGRHRLLASM